MSNYSDRALFDRIVTQGFGNGGPANPHNWVHSIPYNISGGLKCTKCHKHWNSDEFEPKGNCSNNSVKTAIANIHKAAQK